MKFISSNRPTGNVRKKEIWERLQISGVATGIFHSSFSVMIILKLELVEKTGN